MTLCIDVLTYTARQDLKERHVNMIGFSSILGVYGHENMQMLHHSLITYSGLFLSAGKIVFLAGPGVAVISYLVVGTILW